MNTLRITGAPCVLVSLWFLLTSCASPAMTTDPAPWFDTRYSPPTELSTSRMHLEPLAAQHVELDFAALMGSREHLQATLRWGSWPRGDFTVDENRKDLERHWQEFVDREGYAYTVLTPDRTRCIGCIYLEPTGTRASPTNEAALAYWVIEDELATDLDGHLLAEVIAWIERDWSFDRVVIPTHIDNKRGVAVAARVALQRLDSISLTEESPDDAHVIAVWKR